jgi:mannose-6-phosphate isomerase
LASQPAWSLQPLRLVPTRVWRTYRGGALLETWQGKPDPQDSNLPEDWIASLVRARNPIRPGIIDEGLSEVDLSTGRALLVDLVQQDPAAYLGPKHVAAWGCTLGVLVKALDSAVRLALQVHPDPRAARDLFASRFGKREAWYIIGGREIAGEPPYVLLGFKPGTTRARWQTLFERQDIPAMVNCLHRFPVRPGDLFMVEGGTPHALGAGCLLLEIQEPTDYTLRPERTTAAGSLVSDEQCHQGIGFERMLDCFHYEGLAQDEVAARWRLSPSARQERPGGCTRTLLPGGPGSAFSADLLEVEGGMAWAVPAPFAVLAVLAGTGSLSVPGGKPVPLRQGHHLFLPHGVREVQIQNAGPGTLVVAACYPPVSGATKETDSHT